MLNLTTYLPWKRYCWSYGYCTHYGVEHVHKRKRDIKMKTYSEIELMVTTRISYEIYGKQFAVDMYGVTIIMIKN